MNRSKDKGVYRRIPVTIVSADTEPIQPYLIELKLTQLLVENEKRQCIQWRPRVFFQLIESLQPVVVEGFSLLFVPKG